MGARLLTSRTMPEERKRSRFGFRIFLLTSCCSATFGWLPANALEITGYNATVHDRFSSGYPANPVENTDPAFIGLGLNWAGVGWATDNATKSFGFLSPMHYLVARHYGGAPQIRLFADGSLLTFSQAGTENINYGMVFEGDTVGDLSLGTLTTEVPSSKGLPRYAILDLNDTSAANTPANYQNLSVLLYGRGPNASSSTRIGETTIASVTVSGNSTYFLTTRDDVQLQSGDSGSPALHRWTNPDGIDELTLVGNHAAISDTYNFINFLGTYQVIAKLNELMNDDGFALRVVGDPTHTWVGTASININNRRSWGLPSLQSAPTDKFVVFDGDSAGGDRQVNVNADHNLRGLYFVSSETSTGFTFGGSYTLTIGRGGITNYDDVVQEFEAPLALGSSQYWDGGPGGLVTQSIATNGYLLEITGAAKNRINGSLSGSGALAVTGGELELTTNSSYTGDTWVHAGRLTVNNSSGSATGNGNVYVAAEAILSGNGTVAGPVYVSGAISPGESIGTLTVGNNLTWNAGDAWMFDLGTAASSAAAIAGESTQDSLVIGGEFLKGTGENWTFDFRETGSLGWYRLISWSNGTTFASDDFVATNLKDGKNGDFAVDTEAKALLLHVVPEPGSTMLFVFSGALLWVSRCYGRNRR